MGIISRLFRIISFFALETDYLYQAEKWSDNIWNRIREAYCGDGLLVEKDRKLFRRFRITFEDGTTGIFFDEEDRGIPTDELELKPYHKRELEKNGYFILKHYNG